ncbi:ArsR family transcriptional regulator [Kitasatospora sp. MMS16-BH015]|uniref:helix-turn-helix transcriptional regulator n=1 Tax=Kitasatospora sp. MMS16-BH015 TaxID=2018025 RepID=UPI000CA2B713|nr:ArsR family transcriptional regulator [Kitasatospora sp. MMS16-BH015]AUG80175.1 ArsR family transcriptional regulator [Kitasatospora sp. MMS16-BH015]
MREHSHESEAEQAPDFGVPATAAEVLLDGHRATRDRVARSILDHGPSSAADLAGRLGLTSAAVRRHLDGLLAAGLVEAREQRVYGSRGRGRPAKVFALTESGRDAFYQAYDQLAADALRWISEAVGGGEAGEEAVAAFARARFAKQAQKYLDEIERAGDRTEALAQALSADGYAATVRRVPSAAGAKAPAGAQLCQHHCPVAHIAEQFPQLCEAETEVFSQLLGTHVQRLATIAHGDGVCTTHVPAPGAASSPGSRRAPGAAPTAGTSHPSAPASARRNLA